MTAAESARLVAMLLAAYPQAQFGPASSAMYERSLADLDPAMALAAIRRIIATSRWMPTIAEIRRAAIEVDRGPGRLGAEAYGEVLEAIRRVGAYRPAPDFSDSLVGECVRLMGWRSLCLGGNEASDRARFIELYDGLRERGRLEAASGRALPQAPSGFALRGLGRMPEFALMGVGKGKP